MFDFKLTKNSTIKSFYNQNTQNEPYNLLNHFLFLRKSTITSFFVNSLIDTPIILKKSKSLFLTSFELPIKRFTNYLMRGGLYSKALKNLTESMFNFSLV
jgi:hypothetical protein